MTGLRVEDFDYGLPPELIAQEPPVERGQSRMLVMDRATGAPILDLLTKAVEKLPPDRRNLQAEAYRATAEVLEAIGEKAQAVEYYECALQMNPKIPVNKRLASLKKALPPA